MDYLWEDVNLSSEKNLLFDRCNLSKRVCTVVASLSELSGAFFFLFPLLIHPSPGWRSCLNMPTRAHCAASLCLCGSSSVFLRLVLLLLPFIFWSARSFHSFCFYLLSCCDFLSAASFMLNVALPPFLIVIMIIGRRKHEEMHHFYNQ